MAYSFRPVTRADLPMIATWLAEPHVARWWDDGGPGHGRGESIAEIEAALDDPSTEPQVIELDGMPIGYIQSYDPHLEDGHPYRDQPAGTLGMDLSIGHPGLVGKGHGSAVVRQFVDGLFAQGAPRVVIDPHPDNARAIRAYEKAGFRAFDTRTSQYGPALMMARNAKDEE